MLLALILCLGTLPGTVLAASGTDDTCIAGTPDTSWKPGAATSDDGHFFMVVEDVGPAVRVSTDEGLAAADGDVVSGLRITGIDVELVRSIHDVPGCVDRSRISSVNYPDADGYVHIPEGGFISTVDGKYKPYDVIVLYKITVTGDVGAAYRVTDPGAVYVGGDSMSGVIPEDGDAVLYVTRNFMNIQVGDDGHIRNTATVTPGKGEESNSSSTEATPVVMGKTRMLSFGVNMHFSCLETGEDGVLHESMSLSDIPTAFELSYEYTDTDGIEHAGTWTYDDATVFLEKINGTDRSVPALTWPILSIKIEDGESIPIKFRQSGYVIDGDTGKFVYKSTTVRDIVTRGSSATHSTRWWFTDNYKLSNVTWKEMPQKLRLSYMYLKSVDEVPLSTQTLSYRFYNNDVSDFEITGTLSGTDAVCVADNNGWPTYEWDLGSVKIPAEGTMLEVVSSGGAVNGYRFGFARDNETAETKAQRNAGDGIVFLDNVGSDKSSCTWLFNAYLLPYHSYHWYYSRLNDTGRLDNTYWERDKGIDTGTAYSAALSPPVRSGQKISNYAQTPWPDVYGEGRYKLVQFPSDFTVTMDSLKGPDGVARFDFYYVRMITVTWLKQDGTVIKQEAVPCGGSYDHLYPDGPSETGSWSDPVMDEDDDITIWWEERVLSAFELPRTGGAGTEWLLPLGSVIMSGAGFLLAGFRRRRTGRRI